MEKLFYNYEIPFLRKGEFNQINKKSLKSIVPENKACPIQLCIDYNHNEMKFSWDCTQVKCQEGFFFRYILIIDIESYSNPQEIYFIIETFYKRLKLGDFMKVMLTNDQFKMNWIEKTSQKLTKQEFLFNIKILATNLIKTCQRAIQKLKKFQEPANISVFTKRLHSWSEEAIIKCMDFKTNKSFCYTFSIFFQSTSQNKFNRLNPKFFNFEFYTYLNLDQLDNKFRIFFFQQAKMRLYSAELKLTCLSGQIFLRKQNIFSWYLQKGALHKNFYGLYNNTKYQCGLIVNSYKIQKVGFQVEFTMTMLNQSKYLMRQIYYIQVQNTAETLEEVRQLMVEDYRFNQYSQIPNSIKISASPVEKILIRQNISPECYLTYQKDIFSNQ